MSAHPFGGSGGSASGSDSALLLASAAGAVPTTVVSVDTPPCDSLAVPTDVDELGTVGVFPPDESILASSTVTAIAACTATWHGTPNALVSMTNTTTTSFANVWYVADPETTLTNVDGLVNGMLSFKIDAVGVNTPLIFESLAFDGIFTAGETWHFIIQDYANGLGLLPSAFASIGVPSAGDLVSSGSIIAEVPEPSTAGLLGISLLGVAWARRRARGAASLRPAPGSPSRRAARSTASPPCAGSCTG